MGNSQRRWNNHRAQVLEHYRKHGWTANEMSWTGYLPDSPHRFRPYNVIPHHRLTMHTVPHDILAVADTGQIQLMKANTQEYIFPRARWVHETPLP
jgi:hypothetical protein